jgi:hypothetical protein
MSFTTIGPKDIAETKVVEFPFLDELGAGETIASVITSATVTSGVDANPSSILSGASVISGTSVLQRVTGGIAGVTYHLRAVVTANTGTVHVVASDLKVITL